MEDTIKIIVHDKVNTCFSFKGECFEKSQFTATNEIAIHEKSTISRETIRSFTNHENKRKYSDFTTLITLSLVTRKPGVLSKKLACPAV